MQHSSVARSRAFVVVFALLCAVQPALAQFKQQGAKLVGTGAVGKAFQGTSVALAADDATALVGGSGDNGGVGAAWAFVRSGGVWVQQGGKLVGNGAVGHSGQGWSVALSADGNTALIGAPYDNSLAGAAWVFTRSNGVWSQQTKLVGTGADGTASQGWSVALSADGNTALVGGPFDGNPGATWVFTRSAGVWTQQGNKLVGTGSATANPEQGKSVSLSSDGNTAIVGGNNDGVGPEGATWVFTRSASVWAQQGPKLVGTGSVNPAEQGASVALAGEGDIAIIGGPDDNSVAGSVWIFTQSGGVWSQQGSKLVGSDSAAGSVLGYSVAMPFSGNSALVGGPGDNGNTGAAWVFAQSGGVWSQQGSKLIGSGAVGAAWQGTAVALSPDSTMAIVGGNADNANAGAAWVYVSHSAVASHDFYSDGRSSILWRNTAGTLALWQMSSGQVLSKKTVATVPTSWSVAGQRDFDGDTDADILWRSTNGDVAIWLMHGSTAASKVSLGNVATTWSIAGTGDFNKDGKGDILWRDTSGNLMMWLMNGGKVSSHPSLGTVPTSWSIAGSSGQQIFWRHTTGAVAVWQMNGGTVSSRTSLGTVSTAWSIVGTGDFDGDGNIDILWRHTNGSVAIWFLNSSGGLISSAPVATVATSWSVAETGDFNGDGKSDIVWRNTNGNAAIWIMVGHTISSNLSVGTVATSWHIQGAGAD
jgi:hypothetical protein